MVKTFYLEKSRYKRTPAASHVKITKDSSSDMIDESLYKSMIGSLLYLTISRLDITFVVGVCAHYQSAPRVSHLH